MSVEQQPHAPEQHEKDKTDLNKLASERLEELQKQHEVEVSAESADERIRKAREVIDQPKQPETPAEPVEAAPADPKPPLRFIPPALNYQHTLDSLQRHLKPASRTFSKVIHNTAVEKSSDVLEKTVVRPSVINGALWTAVIVGATFYFTARAYGYPMSGSAMLFALIGGALIGVLGEIIWRAYKRS